MHSRTRDLRAVCREADVLVAAVDSPRLATADMVRDGATVIDVGMNRTEDGLTGDVDFEAVRAKARAITPDDCLCYLCLAGPDRASMRRY